MLSTESTGKPVQNGACQDTTQTGESTCHSFWRMVWKWAVQSKFAGTRFYHINSVSGSFLLSIYLFISSDTFYVSKYFTMRIQMWVRLCPCPHSLGRERAADSSSRVCKRISIESSFQEAIGKGTQEGLDTCLLDNRMSKLNPKWLAGIKVFLSCSPCTTAMKKYTIINPLSTLLSTVNR